MIKKSVVVVLVLLLLSSTIVVAADTCGFWCTLFGGKVVGEAVATSRTELGSAYVNLPDIISDAVLFADSAGNIYLSKEVDDINPLVGIKYNSAANTIYPEGGYKFSSNDGGDSRKGRYIVVRRDDDDTSSYLGIPSPLLRDGDSALGTPLAESATPPPDEAPAPPAGDTASDLTFTYTGKMNRDNENSYLLGIDGHYYEEKLVGEIITLELLPDGIPDDSQLDSRDEGEDYTLPDGVKIDIPVHLESLDLLGDGVSSSSDAPATTPAPSPPGRIDSPTSTTDAINNFNTYVNEQMQKISNLNTKSYEVPGSTEQKTLKKINFDIAALEKSTKSEDKVKVAKLKEERESVLAQIESDKQDILDGMSESAAYGDTSKLSDAEKETLKTKQRAAGKEAFDAVQTAQQALVDARAKATAEQAKATTAERVLAETTKIRTKIETSVGAALEEIGKDLEDRAKALDMTVDVTKVDNEAEYQKKLDDAASAIQARAVEISDTKTERDALQAAETHYTQAQLNLEATNAANPTEWQGGYGYLYALSFIQNTPTYPALTNALFKDFELYKDWRTDVERSFVTYLQSSYFIADACEDYYDVGPSQSLLIQTGPDSYQFVGSLQAERSPNPTTVITCDETRICPQNGQCRDNLCYKDSDPQPMKGYLYKITWGVTAPSDVSFTVRSDEARDQVDFNLQIDNRIWLFRDPETGAVGPNVNHLGLGQNSKSLGLPPIIVEAYPDLFNKVCIRFGDNKPRDIRNNQVEDYCKEFVPSNLGTVDMNSGVDSNGNSAAESSHVGQYCGFEGKC